MMLWHEYLPGDPAQAEGDCVMLNNREWATIIWFGILLLGGLSKRELRSSFGHVLRAVLSPAILFPLGGMLSYVVLEVWLGSKARLWRGDLTKDTVSWLILSALALFFNFEQASKQSHFFRRKVATAFGIAGFLEFLINMFTLNLIAELLLQPFIALLAMVSALGSDGIAKKRADRLLALIGFSLLILTIRQLYANWGDIDKHALALQIALPIWLTIALLPYIYLVSLYANYDSAFRHINHLTHDRKARRRAKLALIIKLHFRSRDSHDFAGPWYQRIASAPKFRAARQVVAQFQRERRDEERAAIEPRQLRGGLVLQRGPRRPAVPSGPAGGSW